MSRAEKFEDEKRRIIESAFSKKEADGSGIEAYDRLVSSDRRKRKEHLLTVVLLLSLRIIHYPHPHSRRLRVSLYPSAATVAASK